MFLRGFIFQTGSGSMWLFYRVDCIIIDSSHYLAQWWRLSIGAYGTYLLEILSKIKSFDSRKCIKNGDNCRGLNIFQCTGTYHNKQNIKTVNNVCDVIKKYRSQLYLTIILSIYVVLVCKGYRVTFVHICACKHKTSCNMGRWYHYMPSNTRSIKNAQRCGALSS